MRDALFGLLLLAMLMLAWIMPEAAVGEIYRWQGADGVVTYSSQPPPGAQRVELPPVTTFDPGAWTYRPPSWDDCEGCGRKVERPAYCGRRAGEVTRACRERH